MLSACVEVGELDIKEMRDKKGRRALEWYAGFAEVVVRAGRALGIAITTAGDRGDDPHATPFTVLAYALEKSLPKGARSKSLAACNKRLQAAMPKKK
jgi:hypothetical protein